MKYKKGQGNLSFRSVKRPKRVNDAFYGCEKVEEIVLALRFIHILRTVNLRQLKGM